MSCRLGWMLSIGLLPGLAAPAAGADLAELLAGLPPESDLVLAGDLGAMGRLLDRAMKELEATPAVAENPETKNLLGMQRTLVDSALGTLRTQMGMDPMKDLGWAVLGMAIPQGPGGPKVALVVQGKFPADLPSRLVPDLKPETLDGLQVWTYEGLKVVVEEGRRLVAASDLELLKRALNSKEIDAGLARRLPELTSAAGQEHLVRLAVFVPPAAREELLRDPSFPAVTLVGGLRWLQLDVDEAGLRLSLGCEGDKTVKKAERLLQGFGEAFLAGSYLWRAYAYVALGLDLRELPELPPQLKGMLENRGALVRTVEQYLPRPEGRPEVRVAGGVARLVVPDKLTRGGVVIMGVLAAVAIPSFISYTRKVKESEGHMNLRTLGMLEESYQAEHNAYQACGRVPSKTPGGTAVPWPGDKCFDELKFKPQEAGYFSYEIALEGDSFQAYARCDLDDDGQERVLRYDPRTRQIEVLTPDAW